MSSEYLSRGNSGGHPRDLGFVGVLRVTMAENLNGSGDPVLNH